MERRRIGKTALECSRVGLGTWGLGGRNSVGGLEFGWPEITDPQRLVSAALDLGVSLFDSSDFYGNGRAEELLGACIGDRPDVIVATKGGLVAELAGSDPGRDFSAAHIEKAVDGSLRRLRRKTIDLYQLHGPPLNVLEHEETLRILERMVTSGKVRYVGVSLKASHLAPNALSSWSAVPLVSSLQVQYSLLDPQTVAAVDGSGAESGIIARSVYAHGLLLKQRESFSASPLDHRARKWTPAIRDQVEALWVGAGEDPGRGRAERLLRFALDSRTSPHVLVGASMPSQVEDAIAFASAAPLAHAERLRLWKAAERAFAPRAETIEVAYR